ncbi:phytyltransferase 1, chloroplastic [Seminavis robusta]|uniref:Phytyltransferase 1, chloroplastic n=1 Tax=Seminavis robusta TaxID=568900 RepID=A0A9N8EDP0_9STRA|nr:phytyltransferase 1, chloroplastic [Seminavis robusta]|eukprot:Sro795_g203490.1 phytyltransferase 1, chloroplastic (389) ;mRNA; r:18411-19577
MKTYHQLALLLASASGAACFSSLPQPMASRVAFSAAKSIHYNGPSSPATTLKTSIDATTALDNIVEEEETDKPPFPIVLWRFTRPHTLIGSALAIPAIHFLAAPSFSTAFSTANIVAALYAMVPSLLMNLYITGLNQVTDVEIDKINKPDLPIAAGIMSKKTGIITVLVALIISLSLGVAHPVLGSEGLNVALWGSCILGTLYSLPPFRLKRFPLLAAFCIVAVRGTIINAGFFAHAQSAAFGVSSATALNCLFGNMKCALSSLFFGIFGIVIALMKDVPDVRGDAISNVRTFSVRIGQKRIFHAMRRLLTGLLFAYGAGFMRGAFMAPSALLSAFRGAIGVASVAGGLSVRKEAQGVDPEDPKEVYGFYMHLWKLFYLSYLALFFVR